MILDTIYTRSLIRIEKTKTENLKEKLSGLERSRSNKDKGKTPVYEKTYFSEKEKDRIQSRLPKGHVFDP